MLAISQTLLVAASVDETAVATPEAFRTVGALETTHYIKWGTGVVSGVVEVETSDDPADTGTWAPFATVTFAGTAPNTDYVRVQGTYPAIRHRISTVVVGGTVTTRIEGAMC